jgi:hypothetical protein
LIILRKGIPKSLCNSEKCVLLFAHIHLPFLLGATLSDFNCFLWMQKFLMVAAWKTMWPSSEPSSPLFSAISCTSLSLWAS